MAAWVAMRKHANKKWPTMADLDESKSVDQKRFTTQF